jgi:hypothetical protein
MARDNLCPVCSSVYCAGAEAAAPPDEALGARVAELETKLLGLTQELQQRRQTIPGWIAQRVEEQNQSAVSTAMATSQEATAAMDVAEDAAAVETRLAVASQELLRCAAVSTGASQATTDVRSALEQATDMAAQLSSVQTSASTCLTETDRVIAHAEDKENDVAASMLRRRLEAQRQQQQHASSLLK